MGSAEPFHEQRVEDMVEGPREIAEPRECRQSEKNTCMPGFYYGPVFRCYEDVDCAILKEMSLTARKVLSHRALN